MSGKFLKSVIGVAFALALLPVSAHAVSLTYGGQNNGKASVKATNSTPPSGGSSPIYASAGVFTMINNTAGGSFLAWCLDLYDYLANGDYTELNGPFTGPNTGVNPNPFTGSNGPVLTNDQLAQIENLFEVNATDVEAIYAGVDNIQSAGFQMALWELIYETSGTYSLTTGNFQGGPNTATRINVNNAANTFLGNLGGAIEQNYKLTFWQNDSGTNQNLVSIAAVPVPAAGLLLLSGLVGLGFAARRRRG